jgi:flagellar P-ring protein precursor FlgI
MFAKQLPGVRSYRTCLMTKTIPMLLAILAFAAQANAVKIADITRPGGQRTNVLTGLGLVVGLKGSGDGGDYLPAIRSLASMLGKFSDAAKVEELGKSVNIAIVNLTATVPSTGVRNGDHIDVRVASIGSATSLKNGQLFVTPLQGPLAEGGGIFALAQGPIDLEDPNALTVGIVHGGAVMEVDLHTNIVENGQFSLILESSSANFTNSHLIAKTINGAESINGEELAIAVDATEVVVLIPPSERDHPDSFISRVQQLPVIMLPTEARVIINRANGTMIVTGDVEISPAVIIQQGLTIISTNPPPIPSPTNPVTTSKQAIPIETTPQGGARLQDLVAALDQLRVPVPDRINILEGLYKSGKLHGKLVFESN